MIRTRTNFAGWRLRWLIALLYLAGATMPSVALAWGDGAASAYCLEEITELAVAHEHIHAVGTGHHHDAGPELQSQKTAPSPVTHSHQHDANCCGVYGFAAILPSLSSPVDAAAISAVEPRILVDCLVGCAPDPIDRPPRFLLPM